MDKVRTYVRLLHSIRPLLPEPLNNLFIVFLDLSLKERKALINILRVRHVPDDEQSTLTTVSLAILQKFSQTIYSEHYQTLREVVQHADISAFTLSLLLSCPYPASTVRGIFKDMVTKELQALESTPRPQSFDWHALLSRSLNISPDCRPSPWTNSTFQKMLQTWFKTLQNTIIYPHCGFKSLSKATTREFNNATGNDFDSVSPLQLEQHYAETGEQIGGPCEMRQVWYPTLATPRTYYAMGGSAYFKSRFVRDIFNVLADLLPSTNRYTRVQPSHLRIDERDEVLIYDLTSFTSMYHEQRHFLDFMATITSEISVLLFDTHHGMIRANLGELIRDYNDMNKEPFFSMERVWNIDVILSHHVAGFLGVYSNLITCTLPHGLALSTVRGQPNKSWCAGDDAGAATNSEDPNSKSDAFRSARAQGIIAEDKTFSDRENDPAIALKRRFIRLPNFCTLDTNILFPPFSVFFEGDSRFSEHYDNPVDRLHTFSSGLMSMLYQMSKSTWDKSEVSFLRMLLPKLYSLMNLPKHGWFPPLCGEGQSTFGGRINFSVPRILGSFWELDPNKALLDAYMPESFLGAYHDDIKWDGTIRGEWVSNSNKHLNMAVRLGYLEKVEIRVTYDIPGEVAQAVYRQYLRDNTKGSTIVYNFSTLCVVPERYNLY